MERANSATEADFAADNKADLRDDNTVVVVVTLLSCSINEVVVDVDVDVVFIVDRMPL